jgi:hypothetical protein
MFLYFEGSKDNRSTHGFQKRIRQASLGGWRFVSVRPAYFAERLLVLKPGFCNAFQPLKTHPK